MTFLGNLIVDDSAASAGGILEFQLRLPWYRSLPLSSVTHLDLTVNGTEVPQSAITVVLNDQEFTVAQLAAEWQQFWFIQDAATVRIHDEALAAAPSAEVTVHLALRSPYILIGPETALETHATKTHLFDTVKESAQ